jgi:hypothetical protein
VLGNGLQRVGGWLGLLSGEAGEEDPRPTKLIEFAFKVESTARLLRMDVETIANRKTHLSTPRRTVRSGYVSNRSAVGARHKPHEKNS